MTLEDMLARLQKVRKSGSHNWLACCPAHDDRSPSMTIARGDNGGIVMHCFAGCSNEEIVASLGLEMSDLMPERLPQGREHVAGRARPFPVADVFEAVADETFYVAYMAATMACGHKLTDTDKKLLEQSYSRIMEARRVAFGER